MAELPILSESDKVTGPQKRDARMPAVDQAGPVDGISPSARRKASPRTALVKETSELIMAVVERGQRILADAAARYGLTELQIQVLRYLYRSGPTPIGVLAEYLDNDPSTLTTFIDRLEQRRHVERRNDPHDRRVKRIALTDSGERTVEELRDHLAKVAPVAKLTMAQLRQLRTLLIEIDNEASVPDKNMKNPG
jgi:DNA-binding MarR family transcriptional regulator